MKNEVPIKVRVFREQYGVKESRMTAILGAMFPGEARVKYVVPSQVVRFMREHFNCTIADFKAMRQRALQDKAA